MCRQVVFAEDSVEGVCANAQQLGDFVRRAFTGDVFRMGSENGVKGSLRR
jgi:hypothetical protein